MFGVIILENDPKNQANHVWAIAIYLFTWMSLVSSLKGYICIAVLKQIILGVI